MQSKELWRIPDHWCWTQIEEVGLVLSGGTPSTKEPRYWGDEINWISPADLTDYTAKRIARGAKGLTRLGLQNSSAGVMPVGSVHFSSRAPIGYVVISAEPLATNQGFKSLVPSDGIFNEYVYYYLKASKQLAEQRASGTTFLELSGSAFGQLPIPLPPTEEQRRIVAKIDELLSELDKGVESIRTARAQLEVYRQSLLKHAFEGKLTADWRQVHIGELSEASSPDRESDTPTANGQELPELPQSWCYQPLGSLIERPRYGTSKKCEYNFEGDGVLRIPNVANGVIDPSDLKGASFTDEERSKYALKSGDILVIRSNGSVSLVGNCALVSEPDEQYLFAGYLIRLRPVDSDLRSDFLAMGLSSHALRIQIEAFAKSTSGVHNVNAKELQSLQIPLCSAAEQDAVVERLSRSLSIVDASVQQLDRELARSAVLREAVLRRAFAGELVPQNATDESASVLLERIRAERDADSNGNKKQKAAS